MSYIKINILRVKLKNAKTNIYTYVSWLHITALQLFYKTSRNWILINYKMFSYLQLAPTPLHNLLSSTLLTAGSKRTKIIVRILLYESFFVWYRDNS